MRDGVRETMKLHMNIQRYSHLGKKICVFSEYEEYSGVMKSSIFGRNEIWLYNKAIPILGFTQPDIRELALYVPLRLLWAEGAICSPPFHVWDGEREIDGAIGKMRRRSPRSITVQVKKNVYVLREHTKNVGSLTRNDCQIARYATNGWDLSSYQIDFESKEELHYIMAFALLFSLAFHSKGGKHMRWIFKDEYAELAHWKALGEGPDN